MQVAIEALHLAGNKMGVGRYLYNLLCILPELSKDHQYFLYSDGRAIEHNFDKSKINYKFLKPIGPLFLWKHLQLPIEQWKKQYDLLFIPSYTTPFINFGPTIVTIHDVIPAMFPEWSSKNEVFRFKTIVRYASKKAKFIIAVSETTRNDIIKLTGISKSKIVIIPEGVDKFFRPIRIDELSQFKTKYRIDQPFILYVGAIHPRRNLKRVIEAFSYIKKEKKIPHKLILIGVIFHKHMVIQLNKWIEENKIKADITVLDYVSDEELRCFYNLADIFIYPSLYEGFGLPVLESMACGTPVITANTSSLKEVAGESAYLINPLQVTEMTKALERLLLDPILYQEYKNRGLERSSQFTWHETAVKTLDLFEMAIR